MRPRHWQMLITLTGKEFVPPFDNPKLLLSELLALELHTFANDVEEICDQAVKEDKMEKGLEGLESRWQSIEWLKDNYKDTG